MTEFVSPLTKLSEDATERPGRDLFREFMQLRSPAAIAAFIELYGLLGVEASSGRGALKVWEREVRAMRAAWSTWRMKGTSTDAMRRALARATGRPTTTRDTALAKANEMLARYTTTEATGAELRPVGRNLLGVLWLQLAAALGREEATCSACDETFGLSRKPRVGKVFCSNACRQADWRRRTKNRD